MAIWKAASQMNAPQSSFVSHCWELAETLENIGLKDMNVVREVAGTINNNAKAMGADRDLVEYSTSDKKQCTGNFVSVIAPKLYFPFRYKEPSDDADMGTVDKDSMVMILRRWAKKVEIEPVISLPIRKSGNLFDSLWDAIGNEFELAQKILKVLQKTGIESATDEMSNEDILRAIKMILDKEKLAKRVGYTGDFDWGLLGATEEFAARLIGGEGQTDTKTDKPKKSRRAPTAEAAACGKWIKSQLELDSTSTKQKLVNEWYEANAKDWKAKFGKLTAASTINRVLQDNPHLWKP